MDEGEREPGPAPPIVRRKAPPRPRKPAGSTVTSVADRIDPLMGSASVEVAEPPRVRPKRQPAAPRKRTPSTKAVDVAVVVDEPLTTELLVFDDLVVADEPQPYVLPKIIPGEPEPVPDEQPTESREAEGAFKPKVLRLTKKLARSLQPVVIPRHRPRVRRVTRVVRHIDTWSVFKIAVLFNIFLYAVCLIAGVMLWRVALNTGTIENIERFFESFGWQTFELNGGEIYHNAWIAGLFAVVGLTGLAVLAATMFNLITDLVGGVRLTVLEEEVTAREQRVTTWPRLLRPSPPPHREPSPD